MLIAFWICVGLLAYSYLLYPLLLMVASIFSRKSHFTDEEFCPSVCMIIPAHNEEGVIAEKLENSLALDYPRERLKIVVVSDASTDATVAVAERFMKDGVVVEDYGQRRGKMGVLNAAVRKIDAEILLLTDANAMFATDAVRRLVQHFADPLVGCVCGAKRISRGRSDIGMTEGLYWRYENFLKILESRTGSCVGADGSIYALRRGLYPYPREDRVIMDDLAVSLKVAEQGCRVLFERDATATEGASVSARDEFKRKARILAGALVAVAYGKKLLVPFKSPVWLQLYSHKLIRWTGGFLMFGALLTNLFLAGYFYRTVLALQSAFYAAALLGLVLQVCGRRAGKLHLAFYFVFTNAAQIAGLFRYFFRPEKAAWERLEREAA